MQVYEHMCGASAVWATRGPGGALWRRAGAFAMLIALLAVGEFAAPTQAQGAINVLARPGAVQTDGCVVAPLLHADESVALDSLVGSLALLHGASGGQRFAPLPRAANLWPAVGGTTCETEEGHVIPCLRDAYVEFDARVPHLTTKLTRLRLLDGAGRAAVDVVVPPEQQTRYVMDGDKLINRVRIEVQQGVTGGPVSSALPDRRVDWSNVRLAELWRGGSPSLINIAPADHHKITFRISGLVVRHGCKGECRAGTGPPLAPCRAAAMSF